MAYEDLREATREINLELIFRTAVEQGGFLGHSLAEQFMDISPEDLPLPKLHYRGYPRAKILSLDPSLSYAAYGRGQAAPIAGTLVVRRLLISQLPSGKADIWVAGQLGSTIFGVDPIDSGMLNGIATRIDRPDLAKFH